VRSGNVCPECAGSLGRAWIVAVGEKDVGGTRREVRKCETCGRSFARRNRWRKWVLQREIDPADLLRGFLARSEFPADVRRGVEARLASGVRASEVWDWVQNEMEWQE